MLSIFTVSLITMIPSLALLLCSFLIRMVESSKKQNKQLAACEI